MTPFASEFEFSLAAEVAPQKLINGNQRFLRGQARFPTVGKETLADLARGQEFESPLTRYIFQALS